MKRRIFIASSTEGLNMAYALQSNLENDVENDAEITVWTQDKFRPSQYILESLEEALGTADFGIFIFSPDDFITIRGAEQATPRDNVVFECGLFVGRLGRLRTAFIQPRQISIHLPSDLGGVTGLMYDSNRQDRNLKAALGSASNDLRRMFHNLPPVGKALPPDFDRPIIERKGLLTERQIDILRYIDDAEQISRMELCKKFSGYQEGELHYRLEQLRLLAFIEVSPGPITKETIYRASSLYKNAQQGVHRTMSPSTFKGPNP